MSWVGPSLETDDSTVTAGDATALTTSTSSLCNTKGSGVNQRGLSGDGGSWPLIRTRARGTGSRPGTRERLAEERQAGTRQRGHAADATETRAERRQRGASSLDWGAGKLTEEAMSGSTCGTRRQARRGGGERDVRPHGHSNLPCSQAGPCVFRGILTEPGLMD